MAETVDVVVGRIGKPHGIRGEVTVEVRTDEPERRFATGAALRAEPRGGSAFALPTLTVSRTHWHGTTLLVSFEEIPDRNAAEAARGVLLYTEIPEDESPDDPDEYYDHQLIGLVAYDVRGSELGVVSGVMHGGAQDLLVVTTAEGREALVPFVAALVPEVDPAAGRVVIDDRPGLVTPLED